jgi:hypothetical protein
MINGEGTRKRLEERRDALSRVAHHLHQALPHIRAMQHYNLSHGLDLALPTEREITDALCACHNKLKGDA